MKIEIYVTKDRINEECSGMLAFDCKPWILEQIQHCNTIQGIAIIDDVVAKFSYSPYSNDGDIFCHDEKIRQMVKHIIPYYLYINKEKHFKHIPPNMED